MEAVTLGGVSRVEETEVTEKAKRRTFTAEYKQKILAQVDRALASGEKGAVGALLRREGLYSSHLTEWREARERGEEGRRRDAGRERGGDGVSHAPSARDR